MKTIGQIIKEARVRRKLSKKKLEETTKIKESFIDAIEKENWEKLPEYPVLQGFVSSIAKTLKIDTKHVSALLRRDYPPKKLAINPKPDVTEKFAWSPRLTFMVSTFLVVFFVVGYLLYQFINFNSPPKLDVYEPTEGQEVTQSTVVIRGKTTSDAVVKVNNQPVLIDDDGNFSDELIIYSGTETIDIVATSRSGKQTEVIRKIVPNLK